MLHEMIAITYLTHSGHLFNELSLPIMASNWWETHTQWQKEFSIHMRQEGVL